jgi:hypothetical protein
MVLDILQYPDPRLRKTAALVSAVTPEIRKLVRDLAETMYSLPGVGLAATQVDVHKRVIVIDVSEARDELRVFINPELVAAEGEADREEGCLSVTGYFDKVATALNPVRARRRAASPSSCRRTGCSRWDPARDGSPDRQDVRRLSVTAEARAAFGQAQEEAASRLMRIGFAGTPAFAATALKAILDQGNPVVVVLSQPDRPHGRGLKTETGPVAALPPVAASRCQPSSLKSGAGPRAPDRRRAGRVGRRGVRPHSPAAGP